jgi:hypothetical protein
MQVKNISGVQRTLGFGKRTYVLANNETVTLEEDARVIKHVSNYLAKGFIQVVRGTEASEIGDDAAAPDHLLIRVAAVGNDADTITITPTNVTPQIFEMDAVPTASIEGATAVDIGANAGVTADNLKASINGNTILASLGIVADEVVDNGTAEAWVLVKFMGTATLNTVAVAASAPARIAITKVAGAAFETVSQQTIFVPAVGGTTLVLPTKLGTILNHTVVALTSANAALAYDGTVTAFGGVLFFDDDGDVDLTSTSKLIVTVQGK